MFNEQGCRIPAKIAKSASLLRCTILVRGMQFRGMQFNADRAIAGIACGDDD
jgi:hypothetical protein